MANTLFNVARRQFLEAQINWDQDTMRCALIKTANYTFAATDVSLADVPANARLTAGQLMTTSVTTDGAADAQDVTFAAVPSGNQVGAILIYKDVDGSDANARLIAWLDTATGLPITTNGGDIIVTWDNGVNRIFRL